MKRLLSLGQVIVLLGTLFVVGQTNVQPARAAGCTRANPTITGQVTQIGHPGQRVWLGPIYVTNKDASACGASGFVVSPSVPAGWTGQDAYDGPVSILPGQTWEFSV